MKQTRTAVLGLVIAAAAAQAQLSYEPTGVNRAGYRTWAQMDGAPVYNPGTTYWADDMAALFGADLREHAYSSPLDLADYPAVSNFEQEYAVRTQASARRFEYSWNAMSRMEAGAEILRPDRLMAALSIRGTLAVNVEQDARLRITWTGEAGHVADADLPTGNFNYVEIGVSTQNGSLVAFSAGLGSDDNTVTQPFSFEFDAAAGERIFLDITGALTLTPVDGAFTSTGWDEFQRSAFVIEVVPAPSWIGLAGFVGLAASRRRR